MRRTRWLRRRSGPPQSRRRTPTATTPGTVPTKSGDDRCRRRCHLRLHSSPGCPRHYCRARLGLPNCRWGGGAAAATGRPCPLRRPCAAPRSGPRTSTDFLRLAGGAPAPPPGASAPPAAARRTCLGCSEAAPRAPTGAQSPVRRRRTQIPGTAAGHFRGGLQGHPLREQRLGRPVPSFPSRWACPTTTTTRPQRNRRTQRP